MNLLTTFVLASVHQLFEPLWHLEMKLRAARSLFDTLVTMHTEELRLLAALKEYPLSEATEEAVRRAEDALRAHKVSPMAELADCAEHHCQNWPGCCEHADNCHPLHALNEARNAYGARGELQRQLDKLCQERDRFRRTTGL
jgi:hypothetical protein